MWGVDVPAGFINVFRFGAARLPRRQSTAKRPVMNHDVQTKQSMRRVYIKAIRRRRRRQNSWQMLRSLAVVRVTGRVVVRLDGVREVHQVA
jgi:hypothetical protein